MSVKVLKRFPYFIHDELNLLGCETLVFLIVQSTQSWIDNLLGGDDDMEEIGAGGGGGGGFYLSSLFAGFEFRFKVKDYRAMSDDDLGEADDGL